MSVAGWPIVYVSGHSGPSLEEPLLTVNEAASVLRVSRSQMYALVRAGEVRSYRVGKRFRFDRRDLRLYLGRDEAPSEA